MGSQPESVEERRGVGCPGWLGSLPDVPSMASAHRAYFPPNSPTRHDVLLSETQWAGERASVFLRELPPLPNVPRPRSPQPVAFGNQFGTSRGRARALQGTPTDQIGKQKQSRAPCRQPILGAPKEDGQGVRSRSRQNHSTRRKIPPGGDGVGEEHSNPSHRIARIFSR